MCIRDRVYIRYKSAFFVTPTLPAPCGVVASALLCCLSLVPPAVCPSLLESATTVCASFLQSLSTYVHTPTPHSILRFRPAPQTPDLHTSNLPRQQRNEIPSLEKNTRTCFTTFMLKAFFLQHVGNVSSIYRNNLRVENNFPFQPPDAPFHCAAAARARTGAAA